MVTKITVIGDGGMGTICAIMLAENGHDVHLWSAFEDQGRQMADDRENKRFLPGCKLPKNVSITCDGAAALRNAEFAISAVPTEFLRGVWGTLAPDTPDNLPICSVTKGIENDTLMRPSEIIIEVLGVKNPKREIAALSGPSIAPEIAQKLPATVTVAGKSPELIGKIQQCIARDYFRVYTNPDLIGVELAGATKNVIAIAAGCLDGLRYGVNAKAALLTRGLAEITKLGLACNAEAKTFAGLAGMGDLVTTCFSPVGRNRTFGQAIGAGQTVAQAAESANGVVEGLSTTKSVNELAVKKNVDMPITNAIYQVLFESVPPQKAITNLMTRPLKGE
jgi:glycerol-3-phosphate dehydrogenase (NAD(P)+)